MAVQHPAPSAKICVKLRNIVRKKCTSLIKTNLSTAVFFKALKWSVAGELISKALQPLIFIVLARLLTPNDYGVVAAAVMVISFTQIFWEAGMAKALIQRQTRIDESATIAFWINLGMALIFSALLFIFSDQLAMLLFQDSRVSAVLKVMTIQIVLGALASIHTALLQKEFKFDRLFWVRLTTVALPGLVSIPLAWYGLSYWALVVGTLSGQFMQVILLWRVYRWTPSFSFDSQLAKDLIKFGSWVGLSGLLMWFFVWVDSLFVGSYLGTHQLGLYRTGSQFAIMIYGLLFAPLLPVLYSHFSGIQNDRERLKNILFRVIKIITLISIPVAFLVFTLSGPIETIVFGDKWRGIGFVLGIMSLTQGYSWVVGANGEVYRAIGKPSYETAVNFIMLGVYLIGYFISIQQSFEIFVWTRFGLSLAACCVHVFFGWLAVRLNAFSILRVVLLATILGGIAPLFHRLTLLLTDDPFFQAFVTGALSVLVMGMLIFLVERNGVVKDVLNLFQRKGDA